MQMNTNLKTMRNPFGILVAQLILALNMVLAPAARAAVTVVSAKIS
jgi:hypothetical protein